MRVPGNDGAVEGDEDLLCLLASDEAVNPSVFRWNGPMELESLNGALSDDQIACPLALRLLWLRKGSGELFESDQQPADPVERNLLRPR